MPVISEHQNLTIISILGIRISRRKQNANPSDNNSTFEKRRISEAQMMQESESSALPEKPLLPDSSTVSPNVEHRLQPTPPPDGTENESSSSPSNSSSQQRDVHESLLSSVRFHHTPQSSISHPSASRNPPLPSRLGSLPVVTAAHLNHPEPPAPTIAYNSSPMRIHTQISYEPELQFENNQVDENPPYQAEYMQNEILFVPSPTEYTSFEALYSNFPPPIYHSPNSTSYTSMSSSSEMAPAAPPQAPFSTVDGTLNYRQDPTLPRRRSYTKTLSNGSGITGEIIISGINGEGIGKNAMSTGPGLGGQQWRRHTRVFGGGVCMACEESEHRRMTS